MNMGGVSVITWWKENKRALVEREMSKNKNKGLILLSYNPSQI